MIRKSKILSLENNPYSSASSDSGLGGVENRKRIEETRKIKFFNFSLKTIVFLGNLDDDDDFELPANWPDLDFHRKKSCLLSRIFSTCVTKAINHS